MIEPDFDQIALDLIETLLAKEDVSPTVQSKALAQIAIVERLRRVWNARGGADMEAIDAAVAYNQDGLITGKRYQIERAIRTVDR